MGAERTQHVIDAIDGALADEEWPDAMRWSPDPEAVDDAPAPFDGALVWQPPQRYEQLSRRTAVDWGTPRHPLPERVTVAGYRDRRRPVDHRSLVQGRMVPRHLRELDVDAAVHVAPAGTEPPGAGEWTTVGQLVDDIAFGFDGTRDGDVVWSPRRGAHRRTPQLQLEPWQVEVAAAAFGEAFQQAAAGIARIFAASAEDIGRLMATLAELAVDGDRDRPTPPPPSLRETDPRA